MPTYGYRCEKNGHEYEIVQSISAAPLTRCKTCGSNVNRIFYPVGIVFKGPGFYATDSRGGGSLKTFGDTSESDGKSDNGEAATAGASKADTKAEAKSEGKAKAKSDSKPTSGSAAKKP